MRPTDLLLTFILAAVACFSGAATVAILGAGLEWGWSGWAALHLSLLGGVSLLVIGVSQFFVTAFLATTPPSRPMITAQIAAWIAGAVAVVVGVTASVDALILSGAALLLVTLGLYGIALARLRSRSLQRAPWASRWYSCAALWLVPGIALGVMMALPVPWAHGSLLGAHLACNLAGWLGGAIVGTLHTFAPSLTQTRLRFARLQPVTFAAWSAGTLALALGYGFGSGDLVTAGWLLLICGAGLLAVNLIASVRASERPLSLPARLVIEAQIFLPLGLGVGLVSALGHPLAPLAGRDRTVLAILLLAGWIGMTVLGSMLHLLSVVVHVRKLTRPVR